MRTVCVCAAEQAWTCRPTAPSLPGRQLAGGPPDPGALAPSRKRRATGGKQRPEPTDRGPNNEGTRFQGRTGLASGLMAAHPVQER